LAQSTFKINKYKDVNILELVLKKCIYINVPFYLAKIGTLNKINRLGGLEIKRNTLK
jgi:hypothetical protein